ncbi:Quinolone resistance protein NorA [Diplonema papillatum]|nr:Quinolone resistance protein NorA [Diplonema papillatum]
MRRGWGRVGTGAPAPHGDGGGLLARALGSKPAPLHPARRSMRQAWQAPAGRLSWPQRPATRAPCGVARRWFPLREQRAWRSSVAAEPLCDSDAGEPAAHGPPAGPVLRGFSRPRLAPQGGAPAAADRAFAPGLRGGDSAESGVPAGQLGSWPAHPRGDSTAHVAEEQALKGQHACGVPPRAYSRGDSMSVGTESLPHEARSASPRGDSTAHVAEEQAQKGQHAGAEPGGVPPRAYSRGDSMSVGTESPPHEARPAAAPHRAAPAGSDLAPPRDPSRGARAESPAGGSDPVLTPKTGPGLAPPQGPGAESPADWSDLAPISNETEPGPATPQSPSNSAGFESSTSRSDPVSIPNETAPDPAPPQSPSTSAGAESSGDRSDPASISNEMPDLAPPQRPSASSGARSPADGRTPVAVSSETERELAPPQGPSTSSEAGSPAEGRTQTERDLAPPQSPPTAAGTASLEGAAADTPQSAALLRDPARDDDPPALFTGETTTIVDGLRPKEPSVTGTNEAALEPAAAGSGGAQAVVSPSQAAPCVADEQPRRGERAQAGSDAGVESPWTGKTARAIAILTGSQFLVNASFGIIIPALPMFAAELGLGASGVGAVLSAPSVARVLINMQAGKAADTYGRKPLIIAGSLIAAAGAFATGYATSLATVLPARFVVGVGTAASMAGTSAYMADVTDKMPAYRAQILGVQQTMVTAAFVMGPALGGFLVEAYGIRPAFAIIAGTMTVASLCFSFLDDTQSDIDARRKWRQTTHRFFPAKDGAPAAGCSGKNAGGEEEQRKKTDSDGGKPTTAWMMLRDSRDQQGVAIMTGALFLGYTAQLTLLPLHAGTLLGATTGEIGILFSASSAAGLIGAPVGGYLSDRLGRNAAIVPAAIVCAASSACLAVCQTHAGFLAAIVVWGLGTSIMHPGLKALAAEIAPPHLKGEALSLSRQAGDVAFLIGPLALGFIADAFSCGSALLVTSFAYAAAAVFFTLKTRPKTNAS